MKLTTDWGYDEFGRGWWYKVHLDGRLFSEGDNMDTEGELKAALERDRRAAEGQVKVWAAAQEVVENQPRVVVVVALTEDVARDIASFVCKRMQLPDFIAPCPMAIWSPLPKDVRVAAVCFVGLDFTAASVARWARSTFGHIPVAKIGMVGCWGRSPGSDLLGAP